MQIADDLYAKACKVANVYDEFILSGISIESVDYFTCQSRQEYWVSNLQAALTNIVFKEQSLLAIQKESAKPPHAGIQNATTEQFGKKSWNRNSAKDVSTRTTT